MKERPNILRDILIKHLEYKSYSALKYNLSQDSCIIQGFTMVFRRKEIRQQLREKELKDDPKAAENNKQ